MGHLPLLDDLAIIAGLGVLVAVVLSRVNLPTTAGLLLAGALAGPAGFGLVSGRAAIDVMAELGVMLLLFTVGLELPVARLKAMLKPVMVAGGLQVGLTTAAVTLGAVALGEPLSRGVFYGFMGALSSTAIVLRAVAERRDIDAPHGRLIVGVLVFQDLCLVPMALLVPLLGAAGGVGAAAAGIALVGLKLVVVVVVTALFAKLVVPGLLNWVAGSRSEEVFLFAVLALCLGAGWATQRLDLSLALGAFLGGLAIATTPFGHRALGAVLPLRDAFVSVFFVSLGMLFDGRAILQSPLLVLAAVGVLVVGKGLLATLTAVLVRSPPRTAWLTGVALAQFGEFGFVLAQLGERHGVVTRGELTPILSAGIVSMFLTPVLVRVAPSVTVGERVLAPVTKLLEPRAKRPAPASAAVAAPSGHVVLVGYGVAGRLLARALEASGVKTVALELNAAAVQTAQDAGENVMLADATSAEALRHAHLDRARAVVVVINDPAGCKRVLDTAKRVAPEVPVLVRTHFLSDKPGLLAQGARDVVAEEIEGAVEVLARLLRWLDVPRNDIERRVKEARLQTQTSEATLTVPRRSLGEMPALADLKLEQLAVEPGSEAEGKSVVELELRKRTSSTLVAVRRGGGLLQSDLSTLRLAAGDCLYVAGPGEGLKTALAMCSAPPPPPPNKDDSSEGAKG